MRTFLTKRRLAIWGIGLALVAGIWIGRWRVASVALWAFRPRHKPVSGSQWWSQAMGPKGVSSALPALPDVPPADRPELVRRASTLPKDRGVAVLWLLMQEGSEEAYQALTARAATGQPLDLAAALPELDLAADCATRQPITAADQRLKQTAARLVLAGGPGGCIPASGVPDRAALERLVALAMTGALPAGCLETIRNRLDDPTLAPDVRRALHLALGLSGPSDSDFLTGRLLTHESPDSRAWSAQALLGSTAGLEARAALATRLDAASPKALEPRLLQQTIAALRWAPN